MWSSLNYSYLFFFILNCIYLYAFFQCCVCMTGNRLMTTEKLNDRHISFQRENCRLLFSRKLNDQYVLSGGIRVRILQKLNVVAFWSWNLDVVAYQSWNLDAVAFCPLKKCLFLSSEKNRLNKSH